MFRFEKSRSSAPEQLWKPRASSMALTQARLIQDFIQSGMPPAEALSMMDHVFPSTPITPAGAPSEESLD
ncbi:hypothetical protein MJO29_010724 [Puccinia striiformis f. sp. tritici]|nr:hypothetical protein MJO29_010724 [Puccinia striiformis f. sp. tritici]